MNFSATSPLAPNEIAASLPSPAGFFRSPAPASAEKPELDEEGLALIVGGHSAFQLLWAGVELDVFSLLARRGPLPAEEIASALDLQAQPARVLLTGLTSLRLLRKTGPRYENSRMAARQLVRGQPGCIIPILAWQHYIVYRGLIDFTESLRQNRNVGLRHFPGTGTTLYERLAADPKLLRVFQEAMSCLSGLANTHLFEHAELSAVTHLVDIGGGDGTNAINLAKDRPWLRATVFDGPSVCDLARRKIAAAGLSDRVEAVPGNCFADALPAGIDGILLAHMLTIWSPAKNLALLRKFHQALPPGGKLLLFNMVSHDDESGPVVCTLGSPYFQAIATGEGMLYAEKDYRLWLRQAGFASVSLQRLPLEHGLFVAVK